MYRVNSTLLDSGLQARDAIATGWGAQDEGSFNLVPDNTGYVVRGSTYINIHPGTGYPIWEGDLPRAPGVPKQPYSRLATIGDSLSMVRGIGGTQGTTDTAIVVNVAGGFTEGYQSTLTRRTYRNADGLFIAKGTMPAQGQSPIVALRSNVNGQLNDISEGFGFTPKTAFGRPYSELTGSRILQAGRFRGRHFIVLRQGIIFSHANSNLFANDSTLPADAEDSFSVSADTYGEFPVAITRHKMVIRTTTGLMSLSSQTVFKSDSVIATESDIDMTSNPVQLDDAIYFTAYDGQSTVVRRLSAQAVGLADNANTLYSRFELPDNITTFTLSASDGAIYISEEAHPTAPVHNPITYRMVIANTQNGPILRFTEIRYGTETLASIGIYLGAHAHKDGLIYGSNAMLSTSPIGYPRLPNYLRMDAVSLPSTGTLLPNQIGFQTGLITTQVAAGDVISTPTYVGTSIPARHVMRDLTGPEAGYPIAAQGSKKGLFTPHTIDRINMRCVGYGAYLLIYSPQHVQPEVAYFGNPSFESKLTPTQATNTMAPLGQDDYNTFTTNTHLFESVVGVNVEADAELQIVPAIGFNIEMQILSFDAIGHYKPVARKP